MAFSGTLQAQNRQALHDDRQGILPADLMETAELRLDAMRSADTVRTPSDLFDRVIILGASVSAGEKAPSPGWLLARHLGTPKERISVFARGGAASDLHLGYLDDIAKLRPTLIVALDLFYHDFKASLLLTQSGKDYLRNYIAWLHQSGAVVALGNIPSLVLLRHGHVNRYLETLQPEFPNLVLVDTRAWIDRLKNEGIEVAIDGKKVSLHRSEVFADRVHLNPLGSALVANILLEQFKVRFPAKLPPDARPIDLSPYLNGD